MSSLNFNNASHTSTKSELFVVDLEFVCVQLKHVQNPLISRLTTCLSLHSSRQRAAGHDLAYFFAVWGDMTWLTGFRPTDEVPSPYAALASRQAVVRAYVLECTGCEPNAVSIDDCLFDIECFAMAQRAHIMIIWLLLARGDPKHMLAGAFASTVPLLGFAQRALERAASEPDVRAEIVQYGLLTTAARHAAKK